jgi:hypothetical protein
MRFVDRQGKEVINGTKCLAVRNNRDGSSTVYAASEEDMKALINDLLESKAQRRQSIIGSRYIVVNVSIQFQMAATLELVQSALAQELIAAIIRIARAYNCMKLKQ